MPSPASWPMGNRPWDRQPGEKLEWHRRFLTYLRLGPGRSIQAAWEALGGQGPVPRSWLDAARAYNWEERARAYDEAPESEQTEEETPISLARLAGRILRLIDREICAIEEREALTDGDLSRLSRIARILHYLNDMTPAIHGQEEVSVRFE